MHYTVAALITQKPSSIIVEEGQNVTLVCKATGQPTPTVMWRKAFGHVSKANIVVAGWNMTILSVTKADGGAYACSVKNLLSQDSAVALVTVIDRLEFVLAPPPTVVANESSNIMLNCAAHGKKDIVWERQGQAIPKNHAIFSNGTLLLRMVSLNDAGTYKCVAKNYHRSIEATSIVKVLSGKPKTCSEIRSRHPGSSSGNYIIDPDGTGGVTPISVYCDMSDKGGVGVTVVSHDSESRTHIGNIRGCGGPGCYRKDVTYTGVNTAQLRALTRVSHNCEQFIKYECNPHARFMEHGFAWWVARDGTRKNYWGGATGYNKMCACGVTNSCSSGAKCNCPTTGGWSDDSGLLTDKSALPVKQIRLGDLNSSSEEGYHTLGKLKCYGQT